MNPVLNGQDTGYLRDRERDASQEALSLPWFLSHSQDMNSRERHTHKVEMR